jgi:transmembrane sensor
LRNAHDWRAVAHRAEWTKAWDRLSRTGFLRETASTSTVDDLLLLSDVARLSGHARDAVVPLERIVREHANDPRAALAAFTLGTMRLDVLDEPGAAAKNIALALRLSLPKALAQDAFARMTEAYSRAGQPEAARAAAVEYRTRFPDGRRSADVDRWSPRD